MRAISFLQMSWMGSCMILFILLIRLLFIQKLPKPLFLILWEMTALRLLLPISISLPLPFSIFTDLSFGVVHNAVKVQSNRTAAPVISDGGSIVTVLWGIGASTLILWFVLSYVHSIRRFRESLPCKNEIVSDWAKRQNGWRSFEIRESDQIISPLTYGIIKPVILLPKKLVQSETTSLTTVLLHEYIHIQRFDSVAKWFFAGALCIHWWNPIVWAFYLFANRDMELSCDSAVIRQLGVEQRSTYALALIRYKETQVQHATLHIYFSKDAITERIESIMKFKKTSSLALMGAALVVVGATSAFAVGHGQTKEPSPLPYGYEIDLSKLDMLPQKDGTILYTQKDIDLADTEGNMNAAVTYRISDELERLEQPIALSELPNEIISGDAETKSLGSLISVAHGDKDHFTSEQWNDILQKIELGEIAWED